MTNEVLEKLKNDLARAIRDNDYERITEISKVLDLSNEQMGYFSSGLTGFPSVDREWLRYYRDGAEDKANNIPVDKTVWDVIEEKLLEYYDYPALEYFGREFSK